jgi:hypothetical protein
MHVQMHVDSFAVPAHLESMYSGVAGKTEKTYVYSYSMVHTILTHRLAQISSAKMSSLYYRKSERQEHIPHIHISLFYVYFCDHNIFLLRVHILGYELFHDF